MKLPIVQWQHGKRRVVAYANFKSEPPAAMDLPVGTAYLNRGKTEFILPDKQAANAE